LANWRCGPGGSGFRRDSRFWGGKGQQAVMSFAGLPTLVLDNGQHGKKGLLRRKLLILCYRAPRCITPSTVVPDFMPRPVPTDSAQRKHLPQSPNPLCILPFAFPTAPPAWQHGGTPVALPGGSRICLRLHDLRRRLPDSCRHCPPAGPTGLPKGGHWAATARTPADHVTH
jgi:hypothetical protein